jgi:hypothetical protein
LPALANPEPLMQQLIDLDRYPLDQPDTPAWHTLVADCKARLAKDGLFNLPGLLSDDVVTAATDELKPVLANNAFIHARSHNIYFSPTVEGLPADHPALTEFETSNHTVCADQISQTAVIRLYEWPPFAMFLAAVMDRPALYTMADPLARVNVMAYHEGQALGWHFDRSEFTTTLLLQAPGSGGDFQYVKDLRSDDSPNHDGVADVILGKRKPVNLALEPGTLNVFKGRNTAHRVTPVTGDKARIIAVFSYYEKPDVMFSNEERVGFYGREG